MKFLIRRMDAILILLAAVVYKSNADPVQVCLIGTCILFVIGWAIDGAIALARKRRKARARRNRERIEDSDRRFAELLLVMEGFNR